MPGAELPPTSRFAADDGSADPALAAVLDRWVGGEAGLPDVVAALAPARVLVPVLAVEHADDGAGHDDGAACGAHAALGHERRASTGVVAVAAPDGRTALPVFTSVAALTAWQATARPMPAEAPRAALAALAEGWDLLVLDPGSPHAVVLPRPAVHALAEGRAWKPAVRDGAVREAVAAAVRRAAAGPGVLTVAAEPGRRAEVAVVVTLEGGLTRAALDRVLADVGARLAADPDVTVAVDSVELRVVGASGAAPSADRTPGAGGAVSGSDAGAAPTPGRGPRWLRRSRR